MSDDTSRSEPHASSDPEYAFPGGLMASGQELPAPLR